MVEETKGCDNVSQWDLGKLERELQRYVNYCRNKQIKRTLRGHIQAIGNWIKKAQEFEARDGSGREGAITDTALSGGVLPGDPMALKLSAYRAFLAKNPRQAQEYLERQPARVQAVLRGEVE
jgi:hypothetical protein